MFKNISGNLSPSNETEPDLFFSFFRVRPILSRAPQWTHRYLQRYDFAGTISFYSLISQSCPRTMNHKIILTNSNICIMPIPSQPRQQLLPLKQQTLQQQHQQQQQQEHRQQQRQLLRRLQFDFSTKSISLMKYLFKVF